VRISAISHVIVAAALLFAPAAASASLLWTGGHGDVAFAYQNGVWDLHVHLEGATLDGEKVDGNFAPDQVEIVIPDSATVTRPDGAAWDFIGVAAGETFWRGPQGLIDSVLEGSPYIGVGSEGIANGAFVNDAFTISLEAVAGPGTFSLFKGGPTKYLSEVGDWMSFYGGGHDHFNWGFSNPGIYEVTLGAMGELVGGGTSELGIGTYKFRVGTSDILGDLDLDFDVDAVDIDLLAAMSPGTVPPVDPMFDLNNDGMVDFGMGPPQTDSDVLLHSILDTEYGDVDLDRDVDASDLDLLVANYGLTGGWADGDLNGSGDVNALDLNVLLRNYGFVAGGGGEGPAAARGRITSVNPEPSTLLVFASFAGIAGIWYLRRKKTRGT
jgi:surface-anchored protein